MNRKNQAFSESYMMVMMKNKRLNIGKEVVIFLSDGVLNPSLSIKPTIFHLSTYLLGCLKDFLFDCLMMKKFLLFLLSFFTLSSVFAEVNPESLLPPEEAFIPTVEINDTTANVRFKIADGYYLYQSKIEAQTEPNNIFGQPSFSDNGEEKEDEFFGKQIIFHQQAEAVFPIENPTDSYELQLIYQGCAEVGICYPPTQTTFQISGSGIYHPPFAKKNIFLKKSNDAATEQSTLEAAADNQQKFQLSRQTLGKNLLMFFLAGLALSFTACMYPLLPIVSSIIVGDKNSSKKRAFILSLIYVQGLALTYTLVGVLAGKTGALLTVWLQQAWVVLLAAGLLVLLALAMFDIIHIQMPTSIQNYFQQKSNQLSGGKIASVFAMGALSALIVGPCVAPPLAFALMYIGKTGDAWLGGAALYALALGTGVPLLLIGTFGGHILPRAGQWMNTIKYGFGILLLAAAVYMATPFIGYTLAVCAYAVLLLMPAVYALRHIKRFSGNTKFMVSLIAALFAMGSLWFTVNSFTQNGSTRLHQLLTLHRYDKNTVRTHFTDVHALKMEIDNAFRADANTPVLLDFYADWCVSCKEMEARTFQNKNVQAAIPMDRLLQIDVTENRPEHQQLLQEYGLFGPPGLFVLYADGSRSDALLGFVEPNEFIEWYQQREK